MILRHLFSLFIMPIIFSVAIFSTLRLLLLLSYPDYFRALNLSAIGEAFVHGWRFDTAISTMAYVLVLLGLLICLWLPALQRLRRPLLWLAFILFAFLWSLALGSVAYFGEVYRHVGAELLLLSQDMDFALSLLSSSRLLWFVAGLLALTCLAYVWRKTVVGPTVRLPNPTLMQRIVITIAILVLGAICARGFVLSGKPLSLIDAYVLGNEQQAALSMNGAFSAVHNMRRANKNDQPLAYFSNDELTALTQQSTLPALQRRIPSFYAQGSEPRNIVIVLLESWSVQYIDGLAGTQYGATPFMDRLITQSSVWENTYAAGQRSIEGIQAILTSVPLLEGQKTIGWGLEQNRLTTLANEANALGYHSVLMQTSSRRSFHMDAIAGALGFNSYYAQEDFPALRQYPVDMPTFGWDYEGLMFFADYLNRPDFAQRPVFSFFFTGTTHEPFPDPGQEFHVRPHGHNDIDNYLNTLRYSDWALEQFMTKMSAHPRYQNTTFVFVADHVLRASATSRQDSFHIPLVIFTPDGSIPAQRIQTVASQYDLLPTISAMLGIEKPISTFGRSLLTEPNFPFSGALSKQGATKIWFSGKEWLTFNAQSGNVHERSSDSVKLSEEYLWNKLRLQQASDLLRRNAWVTIESDSPAH